METSIFRTAICLLIAISLAVFPRTTSAQGKLSQIKESVRTPSVPSKVEESSRDRKRRRRAADQHEYDDEDGNWLGRLLGPVIVPGFLLAVAAPICVPIQLADNGYASMGYFPEYPYQHDINGYMMIDPWVPSEPFTYAFHARTEYADDFDSISRIGTHLRFDTTKRFGFDGEVNYWQEALAARQHDDLWTGDANAVLRFAQADWMQMRTGIGLNWLADDVDTNLGFNFTYGGDFFPADPWVISAEIDLGSLGDETLVHGRFTTGLQWHRAEVFVGYDYYKVDRTELTGVVSGLRLWF